MGRRKIPKSSREEINRISAEKQDRILRHLSEVGALTIKKGGRGPGTDSQRCQKSVWQFASQKRH